MQAIRDYLSANPAIAFATAVFGLVIFISILRMIKSIFKIVVLIIILILLFMNYGKYISFEKIKNMNVPELKNESQNIKKDTKTKIIETFKLGKKDFIYPGNKASERIGLLLGRIDMADETYLNGYLIGKEGRFPGNFFSVWNEYRFYYVPSEIINYNINNTLLIKIYCNYEGAIFGKKAIGRYEEIKLIYSSENFYSKTGNVVVAIMLFMIGLLHLIIYLKRKKDRENLYYSLVCLIFSIYLTNYFAVDIPGLYNSGISYLTFQKLIFSLINLIPLFIILFIHEFINKKIRKLFLIILLLASLIPTVVFIFSPTYEFFAQVKNILQAFLLIPLIYIAVLLIISLFRKNTEVRILILGLSPLFFCNLYDLVIVQFLKTQGVIYLSGIGFPAFIFAMAAILTTRFVHDRNEAEELNISLESKVKERTRQLSDAKDEIQAANEELEAMNDNLVLTNGELEEAQRIYKLDMKMAANVQVNIFTFRCDKV